MKRFAFILSFLMLTSCWKNNEEGEQYYAEDNSPIDSTLVDSVVGQASFSSINSAIVNSQKKDSIIPKKDTAKTTAQKITEAKKKLEEAKKKTKKDKKVAEQKTIESADKEKQQQEKQVDELIETPKN